MFDINRYLYLFAIYLCNMLPFSLSPHHLYLCGKSRTYGGERKWIQSYVNWLVVSKCWLPEVAPRRAFEGASGLCGKKMQ